MPQRLLFIAVLIIGLPPTRGPAQSGGSPYSSFGIGDISPLGWGQARSLAGASVALGGEGFLNLGNPAAHVRGDQASNVMVDLGFTFDYNFFTTDTDEVNQRDGNFSHLALQIRPVRPYSTVIGAEPYSTYRYSIFGERIEDGQGFRYASVNEGEGGTSRIFWSHALQLTQGLSMGGTVSYHLGSTTANESLRPLGEGDGFQVSTQTAYRGFSFDLGLQQSIPLGEASLTLGATFGSGSELRTSQDVVITSLADSLDQGAGSLEGSYSLPLTYGFGATYRRPNWLVTTESSYFGYSTLPTGENAKGRDVWAYTLAGEIALGDPRFRNYYQRLLLRGGASYQTGRLDISGESPPEWIATLGLAVPYRSGRNHLNLSYSYHRRGTQNDGLILEHRHSLGLSFTLRDRWFQRRKFN